VERVDLMRGEEESSLDSLNCEIMVLGVIDALNMMNTQPSMP